MSKIPHSRYVPQRSLAALLVAAALLAAACGDTDPADVPDDGLADASELNDAVTSDMPLADSSTPPPDATQAPDTATDTDTAERPDTVDATDSGEDTSGPVAVCGDGQCTGDETAQSCAEDCACFAARRLWFEDFETGDYARWTSNTYGRDWKDGFCHDNGFSTDHAVSPSHSHRSEITCASDESHRGYGGLQFDGDSVVAAYTNTGEGIQAPYGVVNTYWSYLEVPYDFRDGRWFSFWTVNSDCGWEERVITLGLEDTTWRLTPAHIANTGGTVTFDPDAPAFPRNRWVRTTIYINYHDGTMHLWQDGQKVLAATFSRPSQDICQWHWGAYASSDNTDVVLYEDDLSIWKLEAPWPDFDVEPYFGESIRVCD